MCNTNIPFLIEDTKQKNLEAPQWGLTDYTAKYKQ